MDQAGPGKHDSRHWNEIMHWLRARLSAWRAIDDDRRDELFSETLSACCEVVRKPDCQVRDPQRWLLRVAWTKNKELERRRARESRVLRSFRQDRLTAQPKQDDTCQITPTFSPQEALEPTIVAEVSKLVAKYRDVVRCVYLENRPLPATAQHLGISYRTAQSRIRRALEILRKSTTLERLWRDAV